MAMETVKASVDRAIDALQDYAAHVWTDALAPARSWACHHPASAVGIGTVSLLASYHLYHWATTPSHVWFSISLSGQRGASNPYNFKDSRFGSLEGLGWTTAIESQWKEICHELMTFVSDPPVAFQPYFRPDLVNRKGAWKTLGLMTWGIRNDDILKYFPATTSALSASPLPIIGMSFNHLEPHGEIKEHQGNTNAIHRFHLGLKVPARPPHCGFTVGGEMRAWEEGKLFAFCDAWNHCAKNDTDQGRYILLFDVIRPELAHKSSYICTRVLSDLVFQYLGGRWSLFSLAAKYWPTRALVYLVLVPVMHMFVLFKPNILGWFES